MIKRTALRPDTPLDQTLVAVARDILTDARDAIADGALPADEAVHEFRKAIKRWRAFLRLLEPHLGEDARTLRGAARAAAKRVAGARDLRSTLDALEDVRQAHELDDRALKTVRNRIEQMQAAAEMEQTGRAERGAISEEVTSWLMAVSHWDFSSFAFADFSSALAEGYRRARKAMPEDWQDADDEELHEFRRRTIDHRYQAELLEALWPRMAKLWVDEAQRLRDALGRHRDLALLHAMTAPHQPLARFRKRLSSAIERRQQEHLTQATKIAARVFAEKPRAFRSRIDALWRAGKDES